MENLILAGLFFCRRFLPMCHVEMCKSASTLCTKRDGIQIFRANIIYLSVLASPLANVTESILIVHTQHMQHANRERRFFLL
jgi:hypothetical protein